jgi:hypothetical protein
MPKTVIEYQRDIQRIHEKYGRPIYEMNGLDIGKQDLYIYAKACHKLFLLKENEYREKYEVPSGEQYELPFKRTPGMN